MTVGILILILAVLIMGAIRPHNRRERR